MMDYYITEHYAQGLFDSCNNVQLSFTPNKAMGISCGSHLTDCTPHLWLQYMGGNGPSPYQINFRYELNDTVVVNGTTFTPMNETIVPCSQAVSPGGVACSCVDCPCHPQPPSLFPTNDWKLFGLPGMETLMIVVFVVLTIWIVAGFVYVGMKKRSDGECESNLVF